MTEVFRCISLGIQSERFKDDGITTHTSNEQINVEKSVDSKFSIFAKYANIESLKLYREDHCQFLWKGLRNLSSSYCILDASRPWLCFWILHSLELLSEPIPDNVATQVVDFLKRCQCETGGFAGGPGQLPHLAPTYAAVMALAVIGTEEAYNAINRPNLCKFLKRVKTEFGAFKMHEDGEIDIRGAYCAVSVASLLGLMTDELFDLTPEWITSCQTYEGGFSGYPGLEAHGGYSFCGFAALVLLGKSKLCDTKALLKWTVNKQTRFEGGFQGRTNKLVDGCYSYWQAAILPLIHATFNQQGDCNLSAENWMYDVKALQEYVLVCCQHPEGGLLDKPNKPRDFYHTCYCLSGLSIGQHFAGGNLAHMYVTGHSSNELKPTHALFNISMDAAWQANEYFIKHPVSKSPSTSGDH